jgi:hypothetical protein
VKAKTMLLMLIAVMVWGVRRKLVAYWSVPK